MWDPSGGGQGCSSPCATQEVGSLWRQRVRVSGQHATPADWGREKEQGSATTVGGKGQGNSMQPWRQRVRRPFPLHSTKPPPLPAHLHLPPLPVHGAWELHMCELQVWWGELGKQEGVGVGRETVVMAHSACSPTHPAPDLKKKTVLSLCKSNYIINIYISLLIDKSMKISLIAVM